MRVPAQQAGTSAAAIALATFLTSVTVTRRPGSSRNESVLQPAVIGVPSGMVIVRRLSPRASVIVPEQPCAFFGSQCSARAATTVPRTLFSSPGGATAAQTTSDDARTTAGTAKAERVMGLPWLSGKRSRARASGKGTVSGCDSLTSMAAKLDAGDAFPRLTLNLVDGSTLAVPDDIDAKYKVILFYRGHW